MSRSDAEQISSAVDPVRLRIAEARADERFEPEFIAPAEQVHARLRHRIGDGLEGTRAEALLARYLDELEAVIAQIASSHSRGYWLHLAQSMPAPRIDDASPLLVTRVQRVLMLALLKHGSSSAPVDERPVSTTQRGEMPPSVEPSRADLVDAFALQHLAYEYVLAIQAYRKVGEGARLAVVGEDFLTIPASDEAATLIEDIDRRLELYGEIAAGAPAVLGGDLASLCSASSISLWDSLTVNEIVDAPGGRADFAALVADKVRQAGFAVWAASQSLHHHDGGECHIDVGTAVDDTLYVVGCQASLQRIRTRSADRSARLGCQESLAAGLDEARTLAEFLRAERRGADYEVPADVNRFEHVLCIPGPEFIWTGEFWLTSQIPRICTADELIIALNVLHGLQG